MLTRLRSTLSTLVASVAKPLSVLSGNVYTLAGLVLAALFPIAIVYSPLLGVLILLASGFFDAIDGAVARLRGESSKEGAFLDSVTDRVSDVFYSYGFLLYGYPPLLVMGVMASSLLISYTRAKYEALLSKSMEGVGLMERADRIIAQALVILVDALLSKRAALVLYGLFLALLVATAAHRVYRGLVDIKSQMR